MKFYDWQYRPTLNQLREHIRAAEAEVTVLTRNIADMRRAASALAILLGDVPPPPPPVSPPPPAAKLHHRGGGRSPLVEAIARVLGDEQGPLQLREIVRRVGQAGYPLPGRNYTASSTVCTAMTRSPDRFKRLAKGMYSLKERAT